MNSVKKTISRLWSSPHRVPVVVAVIIGVLLGLWISGGNHDADIHEHGVTAPAHEKKNDAWTCSMHSQIRQPKPGKCPICGMDLIPVSGGRDTAASAEIKLSAHAVKLAEIQVAPVERRFVAAEIRLAGKIEYDETRMGTITSRVPGRIDRLYVDYTGTVVRKGDHLVSLYSPELIAAQQQLLQATRTLRQMDIRVQSPVKTTAERTVTAARERLRLWGLTAAQIKKIEQAKRPEEHLTIYSPMGGIVIEKNAVEGIYVETGTRIYTIADLSRVWVKLDAYESDLSWIRYGQPVEFETEAYPGETFKGKISFIDPVLNPRTRTVSVRVNVENPQLKLKPEMFVRAVVRSNLSVSGKVMEPDLAGKWISPMHPEIVKDKPGRCDICGMPLVKAESLGYVSAGEEDGEAPLVVPASAPLVTGTRAVVYVAVPGEEGTFAGRQVRLGPRSGDHYLVKEGLREGERVVVHGAFKIDSDLQIQAKPSMMNPEGGVTTPAHHHEPETEPLNSENHSKSPPHDPQAAVQEKSQDIPMMFARSIDAVAGHYFDIQYSLSSDDLPGAKKSAQALQKKLFTIDMNLLKGEVHRDWMKLEGKIRADSQKLAQAGDIEIARGHFEHLTAAITSAVGAFGSGNAPIYRFHCPMAFNNRGAYWLQKGSEPRNPYFGDSMLVCHDSMELLVTGEEDER